MRLPLLLKQQLPLLKRHRLLRHRKLLRLNLVAGFPRQTPQPRLLRPKAKLLPRLLPKKQPSKLAF